MYAGVVSLFWLHTCSWLWIGMWTVHVYFYSRQRYTVKYKGCKGSVLASCCLFTEAAAWQSEIQQTQATLTQTGKMCPFIYFVTPKCSHISQPSSCLSGKILQSFLSFPQSQDKEVENREPMMISVHKCSTFPPKLILEWFASLCGNKELKSLLEPLL